MSVNKKRLLLALLGIGLIIILIIPKNKKKVPSLLSSPQPSGQTQPKQGFSELDQQTSSSNQNNSIAKFFINKVFTNQPVTGYSWLGRELIYSTNKGVFVGPKNRVLVQQDINYITWSQNGGAVFQSKNRWWFFDGQKNTTQAITVKGINPVISPDKRFLASIDNQNMEVINLYSLQVKSLNLPETLNRLVWSLYAQNLIAASSNQVYIIDPDDLSFTTINNSFGQLSAVSPQEDYVAFVSPGSVKILSVKNQSGIKTINFESTSTLSVFWLNADWLICVETVASDSLGRRIDYLWKINNFQDKQLIINSMPIVNRLNNQLQLYINPENNILPLAENNGTLWILGLQPNQLPSYTQSGFTFSSLSTRGD